MLNFFPETIFHKIWKTRTKGIKLLVTFRLNLQRADEWILTRILNEVLDVYSELEVVFSLEVIESFTTENDYTSIAPSTMEATTGLK